MDVEEKHSFLHPPRIAIDTLQKIFYIPSMGWLDSEYSISQLRTLARMRSTAATYRRTFSTTTEEDAHAAKISLIQEIDAIPFAGLPFGSASQALREGLSRGARQAFRQSRQATT